MTRLSAADRRTTLLEATVAVMLEKGFARATTRDVATRLGIGRGLIHHYYPTWSDLQRAAVTAVADVAQAKAKSAVASLAPRAALDALLGLLVADPDDAHWRLMADAWDEAQTDPGWARLVIESGAWWRTCLVDVLSPLMSDAEATRDAAWRLLALADGLSGHVLLAGSPLGRDEALRLLRTAAAAELPGAARSG